MPMLDAFAPYKWEALFQRWPDILTAFGTTVLISFLALIIALVLGIIFGVLSVSRFPLFRGITRIYVEVVQNVPLLLQVFVFYAIFPLLGFSMSSFYIGVFAIGLYHGGYMSEVVRSGVGSIHRGQFEAAKSQGFNYWQMMFVIILPQAVRIILPPLAVQAANLIKNTSVLALIAGGELMYFSNSFAGSTSYYGPVYLVAAALYFIVCFPLSRLALYLEKRARSHRRVTTGDATEQLSADPTEVTPGTHDITGHTAADSMAAGVRTMHDTVRIAPAPAAPSPRHPLHVLGDSDDEETARKAYPITGRRAAEIADAIGKETQQHTIDHYGDDEVYFDRKKRTKTGRTGAKYKLDDRRKGYRREPSDHILIGEGSHADADDVPDAQRRGPAGDTTDARLRGPVADAYDGPSKPDADEASENAAKPRGGVEPDDTLSCNGGTSSGESLGKSSGENPGSDGRGE